MNKLIFLLSIILIVGIVSVSGCTDSTTGNKTYSGEGISFNYPDTWEITENDGIITPDGVGGISNMSIKEYASEPPEIPATLESVSANIQNNYGGTYDKIEITIGGVKGIEYIPTSSGEAGQKRTDVYFAKGDNLYNIFITTNDYDTDVQGFEMIINTLKFN